jgi:hypothetical protein
MSHDHVSYLNVAFDAAGTIDAVHDRDRGGVGEILISVFRKEYIR